MRSLLLSISIFLYIGLFAQDINENFEKWSVIEKPINITGMDISPDQTQVALVCGQNDPLLIYDIASRSIVKEIDVKAEFSGYNVYYSRKGNYLLIQERKAETNIKKSKKADYYVIDLSSGKEILRFNRINDAEIGPNEESVYVLQEEQLTVRALPSGKILQKKKIQEARNAIAIKPDGKELAVVVKPTKDDLRQVPSIRDNKKVLKKALKYRHAIAIYDAETLEKKTVVKEVYDNINLMFYTDEGNKLLCFNMAANSYVNVIDAQTHEPLRESYLSRTSMQPDFGYGWQQQYFGIATVHNWPSVNIYNTKTGSMVDTYNTKMKIWKNIKKKVFAGTNTSFVFLPDGRHVLIAFGNSLIKWRIKKS